MTISKPVWITAAVLAALCVCGVSIAVYFHEHTLRTQAEATASAQDKIIAANRAAMDARDKTDAAQQTQAQQQAKAVTTAPQAAQTIVRYVPLPATATSSTQPQAVTIEKRDLTQAAQQKLPDAPAYVAMTQDESIATAKKLIQCDADNKSLATCQADKGDLQKSLTAMTQERDGYKTAVKGGTLLQRLGKAAKCIGISTGLAAVGAVADKSQPGRGAALGAAAGGVGCELF